MDEVNLNYPLNWYISDAMDEYIGHVDSGAAKKMIAQLLPAADGGQTAKIATVQ